MKLSFLPAITIALALFSCNPGTTSTTATAADSLAHPATPDAAPMPAREYKNITVLPTADASPTEDGEEPAPLEYTDSNLVPAAWRDKLATYGVADRHVIAPVAWTGKGALATNGGVAASIYPPGGSDADGPRLTYYSETSCVGCILGHAAEFFKDAREEYGDQYDPKDATHVTNKPGVRVKQVSDKIVSYTLPLEHGLVMQGLVFYGSESPEIDKYYREIKIVLPAAQQLTIDYLADWYLHWWLP